jgi:hypothetical protein
MSDRLTYGLLLQNWSVLESEEDSCTMVPFFYCLGII